METRDEAGILETDHVLVRTMTEADLDAVVAIDEAETGRPRKEYFGRLIERATKESSVLVSLIAEIDDHVAGFVVSSVFYGEFGVAELSATIDSVGVHSGHRRQYVGKALMRQLRLNLTALRVTSIRTEVDWDDFELLSFFKNQGFVPSKRLSLERELDPTAPGD